jgi:DNA-binding protein HU-beta
MNCQEIKLGYILAKKMMLHRCGTYRMCGFLLINEGGYMNRKELAEALATKTETSKAEADRTIGAFIEIISGALKKGDSVSLVGFGSFEVRKRAARVGRNPKTGAELKIKASKVPAFKAGATLKATVNGVKK